MAEEPKMIKYKTEVAEVSATSIVEIPEDAVVAGAMFSGNVWHIICLIPIPEKEEEGKADDDLPPQS